MPLHKILDYYEKEKRKELKDLKMLSLVIKASQTLQVGSEKDARKQKEAYQSFLNSLDPDYEDEKDENVMDFTNTEYVDD